MGFVKLCDCAMSTQRMRLSVILTIGVARNHELKKAF